MKRFVSLALMLVGCGDVFADIDVRKAISVEPVFSPSAVYSGSVMWLSVRARFDGNVALIEDHQFDGSKNVKLAYDRLDFFPGACPTDSVSESAASGSAETETQSDDGSWIFCAAVEIGPFDETTVVPLQMVFWNGTERLSGTGELTVNAVGAQ